MQDGKTAAACLSGACLALLVASDLALLVEYVA